MRLGGGALVLAALVLVGCDALAGIIPAPPRGPAPCGQLFSADRCRVMADQAASELRLTRTILYGVYLEIRAKSDGKVIWNIYEHGWREGVEGVEGVDAVLVFDVFHVDPGATLSIRDLVVR